MRNLNFLSEDFIAVWPKGITDMICCVMRLENVSSVLLHKDGKGVNEMTHPDLILKLIEMLLAERDKNSNLQSQLEEYKKSKD